MTEDSFDYIVIGAGSAGAVIASRLTEDPGVSVLLVEAGGPDRHVWIHVPLGVGKLLTNPRYVWQYVTTAGDGPVTQAVYWPKGRTLGGSSSVNGMVYVRGSRTSWNEWQSLGNAGWGYEQILPYYKKLEHRVGGDADFRGLNGPITISDVAHESGVTAAFIDACRTLGAARLDDYNGPCDAGVSPLQLTMRNGRRCSAATGYLRPARRRENLTVLTHATVSKLLFDGTRCVGIEYVCHDDRRSTAMAESEVILSAGSIESPAILERSGIGNPQVLADAGVDLLVDRKQVGENLHDHFQVRMSFEIRGERTINDMLNSRMSAAAECMRFVFGRRGLLTTSTVTAHSIMSAGRIKGRPDTKVQLALISGKDRYSADGTGVDECPGITLGSFQTHPSSRGSVHIACNDPLAHPVIQPNYLDEVRDRTATVAGLALIRKIAAHPEMQRFIVREILPGPEVTSEKALLDYAVRTGQTSWHPIGTCRMGNDADAVVDPKLRVRGIERLRVADASIMPTMVSTNTNAPTMLIGEKAADLVSEAHERR